MIIQIKVYLNSFDTCAPQWYDNDLYASTLNINTDVVKY